MLWHRNKRPNGPFPCSLKSPAETGITMQDRSFPQSVENSIAAQKFGVGQPVLRKEDDTLVRGKGRYTDDVNLPGQVYGVVVRSTHAHGVIKQLDTSEAKKMPGVL